MTSAAGGRGSDENHVSARCAQPCTAQAHDITQGHHHRHHHHRLAATLASTAPTSTQTRTHTRAGRGGRGRACRRMGGYKGRSRHLESPVCKLDPLENRFAGTGGKNLGVESPADRLKCCSFAWLSFGAVFASPGVCLCVCVARGRLTACLPRNTPGAWGLGA